MKYRVLIERIVLLEAPLQDLQRALGLVRQSKKWNIDPGKVGVLGFSAGGNLTMMGMTSFKERSYSLIDAADQFSCRPDFGILVSRLFGGS